jgi:hypothetical protein
MRKKEYNIKEEESAPFVEEIKQKKREQVEVIIDF